MLRKIALRIVCAKLAPSRIPLSGERAKQRNYYTAQYSLDSENQYFIVDAIGDEVFGRFFENAETGYCLPATLKLEELDPYTVQIDVYKGIYEFSDANELEFIASLFSGRYFLKAMISNIDRWWFGRKPLVVEHRMKILKAIFERSMGNYQYEFVETDIFFDIYTNRVAVHPHHERLWTEFRLIYMSFQEERIIERVEPNKYKLLPRAITLYSDYIDKQQESTTNIGLQKTLILITFFSMIAAIAQAAAAFLRDV